MFKKLNKIEINGKLYTKDEAIDFLQGSLQLQIEINEQQLKAFSKSCCLVNIRRERSENIFTFVKNGKSFNINTYSTMSDDFDGWVRMLDNNNND